MEIELPVLYCRTKRILHKRIPSFPSETQLGYCFMNMTLWILPISKSFVLLIRKIKDYTQICSPFYPSIKVSEVVPHSHFILRFSFIFLVIPLHFIKTTIRFFKSK